MSDWQPIETAPDNRDVLLAFGATGIPYAVAGRFHNGDEWGWSSALLPNDWLEHRPTHWMPLPEAPEASDV